MEKDEQKRIERTAKQRLAALKSNDEEAYLKLLDQTKDTRITQLLRQTNSFWILCRRLLEHNKTKQKFFMVRKSNQLQMKKEKRLTIMKSLIGSKKN